MRKGDLMELAGGEIRRLEELARIELGTDERERLRLQLPRIIEFVRRLDGPPAGEVASGEAVLTASRMADDEPGACLDREEVLAQAPAASKGHFAVPAVLETERKGS